MNETLINNPEEIKIKDLLSKLQVLKNGIISERKKNTEYENEITKIKELKQNLEIELTNKELTISQLSKEKYELVNQLELEKAKSEVNSGSNSSYFSIFSNDQEYKKLQMENIELLKENENLNKKYEKLSKDSEEWKMEYQNLLNMQILKIKQLDIVISEKNIEIKQTQEKLNEMMINWKNLNIEKSGIQNLYLEALKEIKRKDDEQIDNKKLIEENSKKINYYEQTLKKKGDEIAILASKLAEMKNAMIDDRMLLAEFKGQKEGIFFNSDIELSFERDGNDYLMILNESDDDFRKIHIEEIDYFKDNESNKNAIDLCFFEFGKKIKMTIIFSEKIEKIINSYNDFLQKSILDKHYRNEDN